MAQRFFISEPNFLSSRLLVIGNENQGSLLITAHLYKKMDCLSNIVCIFIYKGGFLRPSSIGTMNWRTLLDGLALFRFSMTHSGRRPKNLLTPERRNTQCT